MVLFFSVMLLSNLSLASGFPFSENKNNDGLYGGFLPPDQAFVFSAYADSADKVILSWQIAEGYYLYKKDILPQGVDGAVESVKLKFPEAVIINDPKYGDMEAFTGSLEVPMVLSEPVFNGEHELKIKYKGCAAQGLCYPYIDKKQLLVFNYPEQSFIKTVADDGVEIKFSDNKNEVDNVVDDLNKKSIFWIILSFFGVGVFASFTGCSYPLVPILSAMIIGSDAGKVTLSKSIVLSLVFIFFLAITYGVAGVVVGSFGINLEQITQSRLVLSGFSAIFIFLAFGMFGLFEIKVPSFIANFAASLNSKQKGGNIIGVAVMGVLSAVIVGPCATPFIAGALLYISQEGSSATGGLALFSMGLGTGLPLFILAVGLGTILPKSGGWMKSIQHFGGFVLLALAAYFLGLGIISSQQQLGLYGLIIIAAGIYLFFMFKAKFVAVIMISMTVIVFGVYVIAGAIYGGESVLSPFKAYGETDFVVVDSMKEIIDRTSGDQLGRKVLLKFSADWCKECHVMDEQIYSGSEFKELAKGVVLLKVDMSVLSTEEKEIIKHYKVVAPPTLVFIDGSRKEVRKYRLVGNSGYQKIIDNIGLFVSE